MYKIAIAHTIADKNPLVLQSEDRKLIHSTALLCKENKLSFEVTEEVKPRPVKLKGLD